jgi:hypothetical protein
MGMSVRLAAFDPIVAVPFGVADKLADGQEQGVEGRGGRVTPMPTCHSSSARETDRLAQKANRSSSALA